MPLLLDLSLPSAQAADRKALPTGSVCPYLRIAILNLMPMTVVTEADFIRLLADCEPMVEVIWMKLRTHTPRHVSAEHMDTYYRFFDDICTEHIDGLIVTGAPVEQLDFSEVTYWTELSDIFRWATTHVKSTVYICWAAQAGLYFHYGVPKYPLAKKMFGIFPQKICDPSSPLFTGIDTPFLMPHSRHTEIHEADVRSIETLHIEAISPETGISIVTARNRAEIYITGHTEYAADTLHREYIRDMGKRNDVDLPLHYYPHDNPALEPVWTWHEAAQRLFSNWINCILKH